MLFPRLLGVAERGWHKGPWEGNEDDVERYRSLKTRDWSIFAGKVGYRELRRLDELGVQYRVSPPAARYLQFTTLNIPL